MCSPSILLVHTIFSLFRRDLFNDQHFRFRQWLWHTLYVCRVYGIYCVLSAGGREQNTETEKRAAISTSDKVKKKQVYSMKMCRMQHTIQIIL